MHENVLTFARYRAIIVSHESVSVVRQTMLGGWGTLSPRIARKCPEL